MVEHAGFVRVQGAYRFEIGRIQGPRIPEAGASHRIACSTLWDAGGAEWVDSRTPGEEAIVVISGDGKDRDGQRRDAVQQQRCVGRATRSLLVDMINQIAAQYECIELTAIGELCEISDQAIDQLARMEQERREVGRIALERAGDVVPDGGDV